MSKAWAKSFDLRDFFGPGNGRNGDGIRPIQPVNRVNARIPAKRILNLFTILSTKPITKILITL